MRIATRSLRSNAGNNSPILSSIMRIRKIIHRLRQFLNRRDSRLNMKLAGKKIVLGINDLNKLILLYQRIAIRSLVKLVLRTIRKLLQISFRLLHHTLSSLRVETQTLLIHHILQSLLSWLEIVPCPVERFLTYHLLLFLVQTVKVRMSQTLLNCVSLIRVKSKHLGEEVSSCWFDVGE